jgi:hypothetical protein
MVKAMVHVELGRRVKGLVNTVVQDGVHDKYRSGPSRKGGPVLCLLRVTKTVGRQLHNTGTPKKAKWLR